MKRFYRSKTDRMIAGVCGGLAKYFEIDPVIVRGVFALLGFMGGSGVVLYILLAIITPEEGDPDVVESSPVTSAPEDMRQDALVETPPIGPRNKRRLFAIFIMVLGILILLGNILPLAWLTWKIVGPCVIIALGLYLFIVNKHD